MFIEHVQNFFNAYVSQFTNMCFSWIEPYSSIFSCLQLEKIMMDAAAIHDDFFTISEKRYVNQK